jgi:hypothetical protein
MSRFKASAIHLGLSALVVGAILAIVFFIWYPGFTFRIAGAVSPVLVLVGVDLVLGPLLTMIVYKQGKPGLKFDLAFIAIIQLTAMLYGSYTLYSERPNFLVFAIDRAALVAEKYVDAATLRIDESFDQATGGIKHVFARPPEDPEELRRFVEGVLFDGQPDLELRPEYWEPWKAGADTILAACTPLEQLEAKSDAERQAIGQAQRRYGDEHVALGLLPVGGIAEDLSLLLDLDTLRPLTVVAVSSWPDAPQE